MGNKTGIKWNGVSEGAQPTLDVIGANLQLIVRDPKTQQEWVTTSQDYANFLIDNGIISSSGWGLTGNAGTNPATNFIGTTDAQALVLRSNNVPYIAFDGTGGNIATTDVFSKSGDYAVIAWGTDFISNTITVADSTIIGSSMSVNGIYFDVNGNTKLYIDQITGYVGVNTQSPTAQFYVKNGDFKQEFNEYSIVNTDTALLGAQPGAVLKQDISIDEFVFTGVAGGVANVSYLNTDTNLSTAVYASATVAAVKYSPDYTNNAIWNGFDVDTSGITTRGFRDNVADYIQVWQERNGSELMRVGATGNVGIGTNAPTYKLDVAGDVNAEFIGDALQHRFYAESDDGFSSALMNFGPFSINYDVRDNTSSYRSRINIEPSSGINVKTLANANIILQEDPIVNGNVGIGTITPASKLTVDSGDVEIIGDTSGVILESPNGTRYRVTVANGGTLNVAAV